MLHFHLICTVSISFIFLLFLLLNIYIELKNLQPKLLTKTDLLNIEKYIQFNSYLVKFNKSYNDEEYIRRLQNFRESLKEISRLNKLDPSAKYGLTKFSDMSKKEFSRRMSINKYRPQCKDITMSSCKLPKSSGLDDYMNYGDGEIPKEFDWRKKNVIGPVVDQKMCAGCWAVATVGVMEAMLAHNRKYRVSLSVQEMLDCTKNQGCSGGNMATALNELCVKYSNKTITTEDNYSPLAMVKGTCLPPKSGLRTRVAWYYRQCDMNETKLAGVIANIGPVTAVINAEPLRSYIDGIIQFSCHRYHGFGGEPVDHAVQIVGYDMSNYIPYYIVKNSWGEEFGINGYVKIAMFNNVCGIREQIIYLNVTTY